MDPVSITAAATSIVFTIVKNGKHFAIIYATYKEAQQSLFMIQTECTVLAAALSQIQGHFSGSAESRMKQLPKVVLDALDMSLLGCTMSLSVLTEEIEGLVKGAELSQTLKRKDKAKFVWKEEIMMGILQQLRGQSMALSLLLKAIDYGSVDRILAVLESGRPYLDKIQSDTATIRGAYKSKAFPASISEFSFKDTESIYDILCDKPTDLEKLDLSEKSWELLEKPKQPSKLLGPMAFLRRKPVSPIVASPVSPSSSLSSPPPYAAPPPPSVPAYQNNNPYAQPAPPPIPAYQNNTTQIAPNTQAVSYGSGSPLPKPASFDDSPWALNTLNKLQSGLDTLVQSGRCPAVGVAIIGPKGTEMAVRGVRKQGNQTPTSRNDLFCISPITGPMLITVMARLVERGLFSWTNTIDEVLPAYRESIHPGHLYTTLEMFAAHISGLSQLVTSAEDGQLWCYLYDGSISAHEGRRAILLSYLRRPPDRTPGPTSFQWNFANLALISLVIETVTGVTCEAVIKAELFDTLEMYHSGFGPPDSARNSTSPSPTQPWPHVPQNGAPPYPSRPNDRMASNPPALWTGDSIHTSLADMCKFLRFCLYGPSDATLAHFMSMTAWEKLTQKVDGTEYSLLNLNVDTRVWAKGTTRSALGQSGGFAASFWIAPNIGKAFACLTNVCGEVGTAVADEAATLCTRFG